MQWPEPSTEGTVVWLAVKNVGIRASYGATSRRMWPHLAHVAVSHGGLSEEPRYWTLVKNELNLQIKLAG